MADQLPAVVQATSSSSARYVLGPDFTLTHILSTNDLTLIHNILGTSEAQNLILGTELITDLPHNN